jgi:hypothetical protein
VGGHGAVLVVNLTRPGWNGVSGRVVGIRLGFQFSKTDDKHGNANGEVDHLKQASKQNFFALLDSFFQIGVRIGFHQVEILPEQFPFLARLVGDRVVFVA